MTVCSDKDETWITPVIKHLINRRLDAYRNKDFAMYHHLKWIGKKAINSAKLKWCQRTQNSTRDLWQVVNTITDRKTPPPFNSVIIEFHFLRGGSKPN